MNDKKIKPEFEDISAWLDGEENQITEEYRSTEEFKLISDEYKSIDLAIDKVSNVQPDKQLADKIIKACQESHNAPKVQTFHWQRAVFYVAAALIVAVTLSQLKNTDDKAPAVAEVPEQQIPLKSTEDIAIPQEELQLVAIPTESISTKTEVTLESNVKPVWISKKPLDTLNKALATLPHDSRLSQASKDELDGYTALIKLSDHELLRLVTYLTEQDASLLSTQSPQPEDISNIQGTGQELTYQLSILLKKD